MNYEDAEAYVHSFTRLGSQLGLGRMRRLLSLLGNPQNSLRFVHIAGTNGKGSTAKLTAAVLQAAGYRTGMYTSPFVREFRERYQINGEMIERAAFAALVEEISTHVRALAEQGETVTEFEMVTAIGFTWFARQKCDIVALEVGLGGRFDATNVIGTPECAVITAIGLDHMDLLGNSIEKIAFEKAGIIKENTDVVTYPLQAPEAVGVFLEKCAETGSRLIQPNAGAVEIHRCDLEGADFAYAGQEYHIRLVGRHQVYNAVAVIEALRVLQKKGYPIPEEAVRHGLGETEFPARFQVLERNPLLVLDGAHNPQAAESLGTTLDGLEISPKVAVMGMMCDKDYRRTVESIGRRCGAMVCVPVPGHPRALPPVEMAVAAREFCPEVRMAEDYTTALGLAKNLAGSAGMVIVCGSFYMASGILELYGKKQSTREK